MCMPLSVLLPLVVIVSSLGVLAGYALLVACMLPGKL